MKPHPRIRKTIKWGGAAVSVLLVGVWIGSGWVCCGPCKFPQTDAQIWAGQLTVVHRQRISVPVFTDNGGFLGVHSPDMSIATPPSGAFPFTMRLGWLRHESWGAWMLVVPLWPLVIASAAFTASMQKYDSLARRRARHLNLCPNCGYDFTGLATGRICPECGKMPA